MNVTNLWDFSPGFCSFILMEPSNVLIRILLILLGIFLVYMGYKEKLEPLLMLPIGFTMAVVNGGILIMAGKELGTLFVDPMASEPTKLLDALQINFLQPFYNFTFANGLIACLVFMGIGGITDLDFFIARPLIGIAAVSCVPTTAKVAQHCAMEVEETILILPHAMGPNVAGVITTAILCGIYVTLVPLF